MLLGQLGFGKTFTIAYIVRCLKSGDGTFGSNIPTAGTRSSQPHRNVYVYYCKDDGTANKALNVFRSLLSQLLKDRKHLRWHFDTWVREQEEDGGDPTFDPSCLSDLLIALVAMLPQPTFLIIDALDECLLSDRRVLLDFLEQVCGRTSTRVLTSARASQLGGSEKLFPKTAEPICFWDLRDLPQRDRYIAEFLVKHHMNQVSVSEDKVVRQLLVDKLTSGMQDSAIWARMTLEDLVTTPGQVTSPHTIRVYLEENELPTPLTKLYLRVFENVTGRKDACKWLLARSLELIAGTRRRLTFDELLYALSLYTPPSTRRDVSRAKDLAELRHILRSQVKEQIRQLLRPFAELEPMVGFVHQSLKDAVLYEFPALADAASSRLQLWNGVSGIESIMLRTCVDYLLLADFDRTETIPDHEWHDRAHPRLQIDERYCAFSENSLAEPPVCSNTDPFGAFFNYAAHCWTDYLGRAPVDFNLDTVLELASPTSAKHRPWALETGWKPWVGCSSESTTLLCFSVHFGKVSILEQALNRLAQKGDGDRISIVAATIAAIRFRTPDHFRALMNHQSTGMDMQAVGMLETFIDHWWRHMAPLLYMENDGQKLAERTSLVTDLFDTLVSNTIPSPIYLLSQACLQGCIPVIEKIFERAKRDPAFQEELMHPTKGKDPLGCAAWRAEVAILRYFCQQNGIEAHASIRDGIKIPELCSLNLKEEINKLLLDNFPMLVSDREAVTNSRGW